MTASTQPLTLGLGIHILNKQGIAGLIKRLMVQEKSKDLRAFSLTHRDPQILVAMVDRLARAHARKANSIDARDSEIFNDRYQVFSQVIAAAQSLLADPKGKHKGHSLRLTIEGDFDTTPSYKLEMIWTKTQTVLMSAFIDGL